jgi:hypothetical protein
MDVPTRQAYTMAVVSPDERAASAGVALAGAPFVVAGSLKLIYDGLLYRCSGDLSLMQSDRGGRVVKVPGKVNRSWFIQSAGAAGAGQDAPTHF